MHESTVTIRSGDVFLQPVSHTDVRNMADDVVVGFTDGVAWTFVGRQTNGKWWHPLRQRHVDAALRTYEEEDPLFAERVAEALTGTDFSLIRSGGDNPEIPAFVVTEPAATATTNRIPLLHSAAASSGTVDEMLHHVVRNLATPLPKLHAFVIDESAARGSHQVS